jgi:two-component system OmpR family response regulator
MSDKEPTKPSVLVIDDSELVLEFLAAVLEDEGWEVHARMTPFLDAKDVGAVGPLVVLLDLGIPGLTDDDLPFVVSTLRTNGAKHVLFHSGRHESELRELAGASGADGFVCKSAGDDDALVERLARYLT